VADAEQTRSTLPRWTGLAVLVFVLIAIGVVIAATQIPDAKLPTIQPPPRTTTLTFTTTITPSS
jgi:hypothetical protein